MNEHRIALVTGASSGIGKAIVKAFVEDGLKVYGVARNGEKLKMLKEELGGGFEFFTADVTDYKRAEEVAKVIVEKEGKLDVLVNNAGITEDTLFLRMDEEKWKKVIDVNLNGTYNYTHAAIRYMSKQKYGVIINISSVVGIYGNIGQSNYAASKSAIIGFTKSLAKEFGRRGIRIVAVAPGFVETPMTEKLPEKVKELALSHIPLGRFGKPEEIASVVRFLISEDASYITGTVIEVSGGLSF